MKSHVKSSSRSRTRRRICVNCGKSECITAASLVEESSGRKFRHEHMCSSCQVALSEGSSKNVLYWPRSLSVKCYGCRSIRDDRPNVMQFLSKDWLNHWVAEGMMPCGKCVDKLKKNVNKELNDAVKSGQLTHRSETQFNVMLQFEIDKVLERQGESTITVLSAHDLSDVEDVTSNMSDIELLKYCLARDERVEWALVNLSLTIDDLPVNFDAFVHLKSGRRLLLKIAKFNDIDVYIGSETKSEVKDKIERPSIDELEHSHAVEKSVAISQSIARCFNSKFMFVNDNWVLGMRDFANRVKHKKVNRAVRRFNVKDLESNLYFDLERISNVDLKKLIKRTRYRK